MPGVEVEVEVVYDQHGGGGEDEDGEEDGVPRMGVKEEAGDRGREILYAYSFSAPYPNLTREREEDGGGGGGARYLAVVQAGVVPGKEGVDEEGEEEEEEEEEVGQEEWVHV